MENNNDHDDDTVLSFRQTLPNLYILKIKNETQYFVTFYTCPSQALMGYSKGRQYNAHFLEKNKILTLLAANHILISCF